MIGQYRVEGCHHLEERKLLHEVIRMAHFMVDQLPQGEHHSWGEGIKLWSTATTCIARLYRQPTYCSWMRHHT